MDKDEWERDEKVKMENEGKIEKKKNGLREFWSYHTLICIFSSSTLHYKL